MALQKLETLEVKHQSLLLAMLLFGSREFDALLSHLPEGIAGMFKEQAVHLVEIDRSKRIQLLVAHLKRLLTYQSESRLLSIEPSWLAQALGKESGEMAKSVLASLPPPLARQVVQRLANPSEFAALPPLPEGVQAIVFRAFEGRFAPMPHEEFDDTLELRHMLLLRAKDLVILARALGQNALAAALSGLGMQATAAFLAHFSEEIQNDVINAVKDIETPQPLEAESAKMLLGAVFVNYQNVEDLFHKSGLFLMAQAFAEKEPRLLPSFAQRLPFAHGQILLELAKLKAKESHFLSQILATLIVLSKSKQIDERFSQCSISASLS